MIDFTYLTYNYVIVLTSCKGSGFLPAQIVPTPTLKGDDARKVWEGIQNYKPSEKIQEGAECLANFFEEMREK